VPFTTNPAGQPQRMVKLQVRSHFGSGVLFSETRPGTPHQLISGVEAAGQGVALPALVPSVSDGLCDVILHPVWDHGRLGKGGQLRCSCPK
jgi:hypothetical protein